MWCLPSIDRMNDEAVKRRREEKKKTRKQILRGEKCECCGKRATTWVEYYDVFSDVPKGKVFLCKKCDENSVIHESDRYFDCEECGRLMIKNYTWENYDTWSEEDGLLCLNCALDKHIAKPENWLNKEAVEKLTFEQVSKSKHLIPVDGTYHKKVLEFVENVELDNSTGGLLTSSSTCSSNPDSGVQMIKEICLKALEKHDGVMIILDATYQFSVSIGVYVKKEVRSKKKFPQQLALSLT